MANPGFVDPLLLLFALMVLEHSTSALFTGNRKWPKRIVYYRSSISFWAYIVMSRVFAGLIGFTVLRHAGRI